MTDRELLELLVSKFETMENKMDSMENKMDSMENKMNSMENKMDSMEKEIRDVKQEVTTVKEQTVLLNNKFDELEAKNAERHSVMSNQILELRRDFSRVEINTAENWIEIAKLKATRVADKVEDYKL